MNVIVPLLALITSIPELVDVFDNHYKENALFAIKATVVSASRRGNGDYILFDGTNLCAFAGRKGISADAGELVVARGRMTTDTYGGHFLHLHGFSHLGDGPVPDIPRIPITTDRIFDSSLLRKFASLTGELIDVIRDDVSPFHVFLVIHDARGLAYVSASIDDLELYRSTLGARVRIDGYIANKPGGVRKHGEQHLSIRDCKNLIVLTPPPSDSFDVPFVDVDGNAPARTVLGLGNRRIDGTVTAVWRGDRLLVWTDDGKTVQANLNAAGSLPPVGVRVSVVGLPETDLLNIVLTHAKWRRADGVPAAFQPPKSVTQDEFFYSANGKRAFRPKFHGQLVRIRGTTLGVSTSLGDVPTLNLAWGQLNLGIDPGVDTGGVLLDIPNGSEIEVTGVCVMESDLYHPSAPFPKIHGFNVVLRSADDIRVISSPPWWTAGRLMAVVGSLIVVLIGILIWNRVLSRMVERKGRQLLKSEIQKVESDLRVDERTRLAVELHDNIAQTLTGVAFQIDAAEKTLTQDRAATARFLDVAKRTLLSCREELRRCLWDLRNHAIENPNFSAAIEQTLKPYAELTRITVRFNVQRSALSDTTAHAVLCIIRELTVNAIRHGKASAVKVAGSREDGRLLFSVRDNGCGFDPDDKPGPSQGHFGIQGIRERVTRLHGAVRIESSPGRGCKTTIEVG